MKHAGWLVLGMGLVGACSGNSGGGTAVAHLARVCAPTSTHSNSAFSVWVTGGCGGSQGDYTCVVNKRDTVVEFSVLGPKPCTDCQCRLFDFQCDVPALGARSWQFSFLENSQFDRAVSVTDQDAVFACNPDGGMP